jgi:hypothetical protein
MIVTLATLKEIEKIKKNSLEKKKKKHIPSTSVFFLQFYDVA